MVDAEELAQVAAGLSARGISTSTVGIGVDYSTEQIEPMAEHGGGMLHHTERPSDIIEVVLAELKNMRATVIDDLEVEVELDGTVGGEGVRLELIGLVERPGAVAALYWVVWWAMRPVARYSACTCRPDAKSRCAFAWRRVGAVSMDASACSAQRN